jgi:histidine triad (HIT) family protein
VTANDPNCIFCRIVRGEVPCRKVYEDEDILAFHDIRPLAPVHLLIIPKEHIPTLTESGETHARALGRMLLVAGRLAREQGAADGFRTIINTGRVGGQEVYHVHAHILGGPDKLPRMLSRS